MSEKVKQDSLDKEDKELMEVLRQIGISGVSTSRDFINHLESIEKDAGLVPFGGGKEKVEYTDKFKGIFEAVIEYTKAKQFFTSGLIRDYLFNQMKLLKEKVEVRKRKGKQKKIKILVTNNEAEEIFTDGVMRGLLTEMAKKKMLIRWLPPKDSDEGWTVRQKKNEETGEVTSYKIPIKTAFFISPKHEIYKEKVEE